MRGRTGRRGKTRKFGATASVASLLVLSTALAACSGATKSANDNPNKGDITMWFWGESDVPGSTKWITKEAKEYGTIHRGVKITVVPQATETLQGAFQTAAQSKSGPDIAMQWATLPVLTHVWQGNVTPLTGLIPKSELSNWLNTDENVSDGKVWAMPLYLLGIPFVWNKELFKKAGLNPDHGPTTWNELLADCAKLKEAGILPIAVGDKDGAFGAWFQSVVGTQYLDSVQQVKDVFAGKANFTSKNYSQYLWLMSNLQKKGYLSSDVASIEATDAWQDFAQGKAAMTWTTDGNVASWVKAGMTHKLGVEKTPQVASGELASYYDSTQSISAFITSWSKTKKASAAFLEWLHQPAQLNSFYTATGAFPADKRFSASKIENPVMRSLYKLDTQPKQLWAENYTPPQVDSSGFRTVAQGVVAGSTSPSAAVQQIQKVIEDWQKQQPTDFKNYKKWAGVQ
jgi:ABC-type glycerol-3-phosphate transport system substrate-binding protein